ncbi:YjbH domain-containing protein [Vibrio salinus]|uniref:YjbH domain-containing protein n=1 Tax=Vibrio salinus TaxID=2899784 RepID=UPI001E33B422|nr:YjbH domain-containing protein [Vibrio salinus]MCE0493796.1 YjbH domain-containing protein [Vibrio salinus]
MIKIRPTRRSPLSLLIFIVVCFPGHPVFANTDPFSGPVLIHSQSDFGGVGLMQMPTARVMDDGEFTFGITNNDDYLNYTVSLQLFPWLETNIRYTQVHELLYSQDESFSGDTDYTDKSIDVKAVLLNEGKLLPQVAVGLRDIGGTGLFDSEYIVGSKQLGPLDFTLGIGWGYIGNRNNLGAEKTGYDCGRGTGYTGNGGSVDLARMFTGCKSLFGGIEYQTPYSPLTIKVEYDANDYRSDFPVTRGADVMVVNTPWNIGLIYTMADWARLRLSYERGNTLTAGISLGTNFDKLRPNWDDEKKPDYQPKHASPTLTNEEWQKLSEDLKKIAGYKDLSIYQSDKSLTIKGSQRKYRDRKEAEERASLLIANSGINSDTYHIIETSNSQALTETVINAHAFKRVADADYPNATFNDASYQQQPSPIQGEKITTPEKDWNFGLSPVLQQSFGGSESFYMYAIGVKANAGYRLNDHFLFSSSLYGNVFDNYDKFKYTVPPDGTTLKRVRTLARKYFNQTFRISNLQLTYLDHFGDNIYTQAYAGYLESMFAGAGSEILYRPMNTNWAIGLNGAYVKQRDPDTVFGIYDKETHYDPTIGRNYFVQTGTLTGHATLYWQPKFWSAFDNSLLKISAGQYLAEDKGVTVDFSKQFSSGVIAGVYATKTNLSASEYGEGSFTKGFYISIPFDLMTVKPSTSRANISWQPLTRDGGQKLGQKFNLYGMTDARAPWYTRPIRN